MDILKTFNELSNYNFLDSCSAFLHFLRNATVVLDPRQSGMGPIVFQESEKGPERENLLHTVAPSPTTVIHNLHSSTLSIKRGYVHI